MGGLICFLDDSYQGAFAIVSVQPTVGGVGYAISRFRVHHGRRNFVHDF